MSIEQSRKIVEAAGECWHEMTETDCSCGVTFVCQGEYLDHNDINNNPDLSRPENRHLLIGYVERICGEDEYKQRDYLRELARLTKPCNFPPPGSMVVGLPKGSSYIGRQFRIHTAPNDAIMTSLCRVVEEESDE